MIDLARTEDVAFVIIAGDLYDGDWRDFSTGLFFAEEMRRLGRPCFVLRGNHDARSQITRSLRLPENVTEFSSRTCQTIHLPDLGVALHGHSFPNRAVPEDLSLGYPDAVPGMLNIGVLHTSSEDAGEHEVYAPCSTSALALKGYEYWALGHIHARRVLSERPWIVFPGNLQGRHPKETGAKGCSLITVEDGRVTGVEHRSVDVLRWAALEVDATGADLGSVTARIADAARAAVADADGRPVLARLTLTGETECHAGLVEDEERLIAECRNAAIEADGQLWVESVRVRTRPVPEKSDDVLAPLRTAFAAGLDDPSLVRELLDHFVALRQRMPAAGRADLVLPADEATLRALAEEAWQTVAVALEAAGR